MSERKRNVVLQLRRSGPTVVTPAFMHPNLGGTDLYHGHDAKAGRPLPPPVLVDPPACACKGKGWHFREHTAKWCSVLTTDELNALTANPTVWWPNPDPLDVTTHAGYVTPPTRPIVIHERPTIDDRGMVLVWVAAAIAFLLALVGTLLLVAGRPPNG